MPVLTDRDKVFFGHFLCAHSSARALKACIQCIKETKTTEIASLLHKIKNHSYQEQRMFFDVPLGLHGIISWYLYVALINYSPTINILIPELNCRNLAITTSLPCFYFSFSIICVFLTKWKTHKIANCLFFVHFWFWLIGSHQDISLVLTVAQGYTMKMIEIYSGNVPHPIFTTNFSFWASSPHSAPLLLLFLTVASIVHLPPSNTLWTYGWACLIAVTNKPFQLSSWISFHSTKPQMRLLCEQNYHRFDLQRLIK